MPMDFQRARIIFRSKRGNAQRETAVVSFPSVVRRAEAALSGFTIGYNNGDHNILTQSINVETPRIERNRVSVDVTFLLRDGSGTIDDPFSGFVDLTVIVDRV